MARNFCGSLSLRIAYFLYFAGTNFCDCKRLVFRAGVNFYLIQHFELPDFSVSECRSLSPVGKDRRVCEQTSVAVIRGIHSVKNNLN